MNLNNEHIMNANEGKSLRDVPSYGESSEQVPQSTMAADEIAKKILEMARRPLSEKCNLEQARRFFQTLLDAGRSNDGSGLIELRILGAGSGLFDDPSKAVNICAQYSGLRPVYFGLNPRKAESLTERSINEISYGRAFGSKDVETYNWLLLDLDSARPSEEKGQSASAEEIERTTVVFKRIFTFLKRKDISFLVGFSGNGMHFLIRLVPQPVTDEFKQKMKAVLNWFDSGFSTDSVKVDVSVHDPARICKSYGTKAIKGISTEERPHRLAHLFYPSSPLQPVDLERAFASEIAEQRELKKPTPAIRRANRLHQNVKGDLSTLNIAGLFQSQGLYEHHVEGNKHAVRCPWESAHSSSSPADTIIFEAEGGSWPGFHCKHSHCNGRALGDVIEYLGADSVSAHCNRPFIPVVTSHSPLAQEPLTDSEKSELEAWGPIRPLPRTLPIAPGVTRKMAADMIPAPLRPWILDIAERLQVPTESVAVCAFSALSGLIGRKIAIFPKRNDPWRVLCVLWCALIDRPSRKKTATLNEAMAPVALLESEARAEFRKKQFEDKAKQAVRKSRMDALKAEMKSAHHEPDNRKAEQILENAQRALAALEQEASDNALVERRFRTSDATVEKLGELLIENPNGLIVHRDELSGWLKGLEKFGHEGDRAFYLESWNGTGHYAVDRIGRGTLHVPALCLVIMGGIQPGRLESYVHDAMKGGGGDDGLLQRFQLTVYPEKPNAEPTFVDRVPDTKSKDQAIRIYRAINELDPLSIGASSPDAGIPGVRFSDDAHGLFADWFLNLEKRLQSESMPPALEAHLGKYRSLMPALALMFHLIEKVSDPSHPNLVQLESARMAAIWCDYLETHARKVYAISINPEGHAAEALAKKIREGRIKDGMPVRDIKRKHWSLLSDNEAVNGALAVLEESEYLRVKTVRTEGASLRVISLNPSLKDCSCAGEEL